MGNFRYTCKFGGTSLADATQITKALDIVRKEPWRRYVVVSAPGRRWPGDDKVTDLLYAWHAAQHDELVSADLCAVIERRFAEIAKDLGVDGGDVQKDIAWTLHRAKQGGPPDFIASRGEFWNAMLVAKALGCPFIPARFVRFDARGRLDMVATQRMADELKLADYERCVIPGFYGHRPDESVKTFSRGGSDLTGAVVAAVTHSDLYENWTDVDGIRMADPRVVPEAKRIDTITFREIRELSYMGADVLHEEVVFPLYKKGIPIHVRNTNAPDAKDAGTVVVPDDARQSARTHAGRIVGVTGRKDFTIIRLEKMLMNSEVGFIGRACDVFTRYGVSLECIPGGLDSICVAVASAAVAGKLDAIVLELQEDCHPDAIQVLPDIALVCTVGNAMHHAKGVAAKVFEAVRDADVNVSTISQCASETSIIIGVANEDCGKAVAAIYRAFEGPAH